MGSISLYDRAVGDYKQGLHALGDAHIDDVMCDMAGYHLQQAVEKLLKYQIELQGDRFPFTHDISQLLDDVVTDVPDWIVANRETLTKYEAHTRYSSVKVASVTNLREWYIFLGEYIQSLKPENDDEFSCEPKL